MIDFSMFSQSRNQPLGGGYAVQAGDISSPFLQPQLLTPVDPDAALRADAPVIGSTVADVVPGPQVQSESNPILHQLEGVESEPLARPVMAVKAPSNPSGQEKGGIAGVIGRLLLGGSGDESSLDASTQKEKQAKRKGVGNASASFSNDPEAAAAGFMNAPGTDGDSLGSTISKIAKMFGGL